MNPWFFWAVILFIVGFRMWHHRKHIKKMREQDEILQLMTGIEELMLTLMEIRRTYPETYICMHTYQDHLQSLIVLLQIKSKLRPRPTDTKILRELQSQVRLRLN